MDGNTKIVDDCRFDIRRCQKVIYTQIVHLFNEMNLFQCINWHSFMIKPNWYLIWLGVSPWIFSLHKIIFFVSVVLYSLILNHLEKWFQASYSHIVGSISYFTIAFSNKLRQGQEDWFWNVEQLCALLRQTVRLLKCPKAHSLMDKSHFIHI